MLDTECRIEFDFEFQALESKLMQVILMHDGHTIPVIPELIKKKYLASVGVTVSLPTQITLEFFGKNLHTDTVIDAQGNIVKDLLVTIKNIKLDGLIINKNFLYEGLTLKATDDTTWIGPIVGFNGKMHIDFAKNNVFSQYMYFLNKWI